MSYSNISTSQLRVIAASYSIPRYWQLSRHELIQALEDRSVDLRISALRKLGQEYKVPNVWRLRKAELLDSLEKSMHKSVRSPRK